ncbi:MAG: hypothetical protein V4773_12060, partial [Verrucomicrobiota bacterium]
ISSLSAALIISSLSGFAASSPLADVVSLPEFKVFDSQPLPAPETWDYVKVGNFEILSNTSPRVTKQFVRDLTEFQIILGIIAPTMRIRSELPVTVVLCGKDNQFQRFVSKPTVRSVRGLSASLVRDSEIASIIMDYESLYRAGDSTFFNLGGRTTSGQAEILDWSSSREVYASEEFVRQYIHLSLSQLNPRPAPWLAEGIANIYSNIDYNNKWIEIGLPKFFGNNYLVTAQASPSLPQANILSADTSNYAGDGLTSYPYSSAAGSFGGTFSYQPSVSLMPMAQLFNVGYESPIVVGQAGGEDYRRNSWKYQATAFVHMCIYGENGKYRKGFLKFAAQVSQQPPTEEFFKECFGVSYKEMAFRIRSYTEFTRYLGTVYKATNGGILNPPEPYALRRATDAEVGRIKGEAYRLSGQDEAARREFVVAYLRGERDPQLLASLGLMARQRHDDTRARTYLEAVAATSPTVPRPRAYLELARLRSSEITKKSGTESLDAPQIAQVLNPLFTAQRLPQQLLPIYLEIASVWEHSNVTPSRDNLAALEYGISLFPQNGELILRTAALLVKYGHKTDAALLIDRTLNSTRDPMLKGKLELLRQQIGSSPTADNQDASSATAVGTRVVAILR